MFLLTNNVYRSQISQEKVLEIQKVIIESNNSLSASSEGLEFDEPSHTYTFRGKTIPCVSDYVEMFAPFDSEKVAEGCSKNPRHQMYGQPVEVILSAWEEKKHKAAENGTFIHAFAEACCLWWEGRPEMIEPQFQDRITVDGLLAKEPQEEAVARFWEDLDPNRFAVIAKETRVVNPILNYAGTFDLLLYDMEEKCYLLRDYKTNEDPFRWFGGHLKAPLSFLKDNDVGKYTLQQNLYALHIESLGMDVTDIQLVWLKKDGQYELIPLEKMEKAVEYAMKTINNQ